MDHIAVLHNTIQEYAWGSKTAIADLLGRPSPAEVPQAELWMGAHPKAPSRLVCDGVEVALDAMVAQAPDAILGLKTAKRFHNRLPYLLKVLAAANPLSIQAHPSLALAREGFERENRAQIPLDAPHRNYKDDNHKPECICALTPFWALNGFRDIAAMHHLLNLAAGEELAAQLRELKDQPDDRGLKRFFSTLMRLAPERVARVTRRVAARARDLAPTDPVFGWIARLYQAYPGDIGVLSPALLNLIRLEPGQAMFLPAGQLHAYLDGLGIELMANSDNVLRGGLTPKHVDVPELLKTLSFSSCEIEILAPEPAGAVEQSYVTGAEEFALSVILPRPGRDYQSPAEHSADILLNVAGEAWIASVKAAQNPIRFPKGTSVLVPAAAGPYVMGGDACIYKATVPLGL